VEAGAKKLPCNHIFHPNCLRSWFQRQQTCPTCRTDVLGELLASLILTFNLPCFLAASRRQAATMPGGMQQQQQANGQLQQPQLGQGQPNLFHPFHFQFHFGQQNQAQNGADQQQQQQQRPPPQFMPGMPPFGLPMMPPQFMQQFQQQHQQVLFLFIKE
jgi:E3 ubiquitin-protein ligase synoviolin